MIIVQNRALYTSSLFKAVQTTNFCSFYGVLCVVNHSISKVSCNNLVVFSAFSWEILAFSHERAQFPLRKRIVHPVAVQESLMLLSVIRNAHGKECGTDPGCSKREYVINPILAS